MGYGNYSYDAHQDITAARSTKSRDEVFNQRSVHPLMNPMGVGMRESRDSVEHPPVACLGADGTDFVDHGVDTAHPAQQGPYLRGRRPPADRGDRKRGAEQVQAVQ